MSSGAERGVFDAPAELGKANQGAYRGGPCEAGEVELVGPLLWLSSGLATRVYSNPACRLGPWSE